jgi:hypothetical protein
MTEEERGRRSPTPAALSSLGPVVQGLRVLPDPLHGQALMRVPADPAQVRVLLDRSRESALAGEPSQDYLAVRSDRQRLSFAVTDGVGSSFLGDVAAQILAAHVAEWLAPQPLTDSERLNSALTRYLHDLSDEMAERVAAWPLPASLSAIVRAALDQQRAYGSEAMVACGVVDISGRRDATVAVAWLGDARVRVVFRDGTHTDHYGQTSDRWSSRLGPRGEIGCQVWPARQVARIIACTDGLLPELESTMELADDELRSRLEELARRPGNDDMALVDVGLSARSIPAAVGRAGGDPREPAARHARPAAPESTLRRLIRAVSSPAPPAPALAEAPPAPALPAAPPTPDVPEASIAPPGDVQAVDGELTWSPVAGAHSYAVQICGEPSFTAAVLYAVRGTTFAVPPVGSPVFVRVRSIVDGVPGPWGSSCQL